MAGFAKRDGWIRAADDSRKKLPKLETKKDYKLLIYLTHPLVLLILFLLTSVLLI